MQKQSLLGPVINFTQLVKYSFNDILILYSLLGFSTAKGELVRGILYPKESTTQLNTEMLKCMKMFFALGIPCMFYTACVFYNYQVKN